VIKEVPVYKEAIQFVEVPTEIIIFEQELKQTG